MSYPNLEILFHWLTNTPELLERACVVVVATYLAIRLEWFRQAMRGVDKRWRSRLIASLFFGVLGILGTINGLVLNVADHVAVAFQPNQSGMDLSQRQAILSFRDMLVLSAGLSAGPWVGFGAGLIAGLHRYQLGGFVGLASGMATLLIGVMAGLARQFWPLAIRPQGTLVVVILTSAIQKLLVLLLGQPTADVLAVIQETVIPETAVNCFGCLLFLSVLQDLERERLRTQAQQAELRSLQAQVEPHFINNTLNAIKALIRNHPDQAADYVVKLARFFDATRHIAKANSITLGEELAHLQNYLEFQQLRFPGAFSFRHDVGQQMLRYRIPPRSLLTLAENALLHGRHGLDKTLDIRLSCMERDQSLILRITDNGRGLVGPDLGKLGAQPIRSERGSGNGLFQLQQSLKLAFDSSAGLGIANQAGGGCEVILTLPKTLRPW